VQNVVRTLPFNVQHGAYVQAAVQQSQLESHARSIHITSFNSASTAVEDVLDPFTLGSIEDVNYYKKLMQPYNPP